MNAASNASVRSSARRWAPALALAGGSLAFVVLIANLIPTEISPLGASGRSKSEPSAPDSPDPEPESP